MSRQQAEQVLRDRRGKAYDPWVVDRFISILDKLEQLDAKDRQGSGSSDATFAQKMPRLDAIVATTAEEREFSELRRDLSRAPNAEAATDVLLRHTKRLVPAATIALYVPQTNAAELAVAACSGVGASAIVGLRVGIGDRISGWAFAHAQSVLNSDASLELGASAREYSTPLRYAAAVPVVDRRIVAILVVYSAEPLERDHGRLLEAIAAMFATTASESQNAAANPSPTRPVLIDAGKRTRQ